MKRVVVIGGGFAGTTIARELEGNCSVTLIDKDSFFEYTPGILRVLVEPKHYQKLHAKHKDCLKKSKIIIGNVKEIGNNFILTDKRKINYDYLAIASGSSYNSPIKEEDIFFAARLKNLLEANRKIEKSKKIIIVGGGLVGVELVAELATHYKNKEITLIHSGPKLLERNNSKTSNYVKGFIEKNNVKIIFNEKIIKNDKKNLIGESTKSYYYDLVFFTVGIKPNTDFMINDFSNLISKGIIVNDYLQIPTKPNIFVAGDVSNIIEEKTAQNAEIHGKVVAKNILALIKGNEMEKYKSKKRLMVISLGKYCGIIEYKGFVLTGFIPAILKSFIEKMVMYKFRA